MTLALGSKNYLWSSKLHYDFLSVCCSSDIPLPPGYLQCVTVIITVAPACPVSACFGSLDGRERRAPFMWSVSHVLLCKTRAALWERSLLALCLLLCASSADGFPGSHGPFVCSVSFMVCTPTPCSSNEVCCLFPLLSSSEGSILRRRSTDTKPNNSC